MAAQEIGKDFSGNAKSAAVEHPFGSRRRRRLVDLAWRIRAEGKTADECADEIEALKMHVLLW